MVKQTKLILSVVVPVYNEMHNLKAFNKALIGVLESADVSPYEVIYVDDGSKDETPGIIRRMIKKNPNIKLLRLSRNFGKENALSAGIAEAKGHAIITLDGDGQHPAEVIHELIAKWLVGAQVVIGVRSNGAAGFPRRIGSTIFYKIYNSLTDQGIEPGSTDYRLIDRQVQQAFLELKESDRMTRGLIDWLGFRREFVYFKAKSRRGGKPTYSRGKLTRLAANSFVSMSPKPLFIFGYIGILITLFAFILGVAVITEQLIFGDPLNWDFTGTAMLGILILFLVGLILLSQGILSLYISHIHSQSKQRPLFVIDDRASIGIK